MSLRIEPTGDAEQPVRFAATCDACRQPVAGREATAVWDTGGAVLAAHGFVLTACSVACSVDIQVHVKIPTAWETAPLATLLHGLLSSVYADELAGLRVTSLQAIADAIVLQRDREGG